VQLGDLILVFGHVVPQVFTFALYNLAANPQYAQPLREEVEAIVEKEGWSRASLSEMRKVDSFLKESIRIDGIDACQSLPLSPAHHAVNSYPFLFSSGLDTQGHKGFYVLRRNIDPERHKDQRGHCSITS
jgi:hypothetical protein